MRLAFCVLALATAGCSTDRQILELKRDRLLQVERSALATREAVDKGSYDPRRYDFYLALDADVFTRALGGIQGSTIDIEASGRPISLSVRKLEMNFRPGSPEVNLDVLARDKQTGVQADLSMDSRLMVEADASNPSKLTARIVATRIVPEVRWGPLQFSKAKFVRALLSLQAWKFTEKLPAMTLPLSSEFHFGMPASTVDSGQLPTGHGSWIRGNLSYPSTETKGRFVVSNILFLNNGVHLFANVEGI